MKRFALRPLFRPLLVLVAIAAVSAMIWGCSNNKSSLTTAPDVSGSTVLGMRGGDAAFQSAVRVQNRHTADLMRRQGVIGTAITVNAAGDPAIMVLTEMPSAFGALPRTLDGLEVIEEVSGKIVAMAGVSHTAKQTAPIQLGTSGGSVTDLANGYCCSGTLGALVQKGGVQYILSNSHVFAGDVVSGGNGKVAAVGDDVTQPGYVDNNCSTSNTNIVGDVSSLSTTYPPTSTPNVDCAIAQVRAGMVSSTGAILEVGTISASTVGASVNQAVKKSGRTTGLTRSTISGLNATISVGYETECGGTAYTKTYTGQIVIKNRRSKFLNSGDSGSLMVEDVSTNPRAVGLLFAGSSTTAIANPIGAVLGQLGATMVGQ